MLRSSNFDLLYTSFSVVITCLFFVAKVSKHFYELLSLLLLSGTQSYHSYQDKSRQQTSGKRKADQREDPRAFAKEKDSFGQSQ